MCELMALSLNRPASAHFSIQQFGGRDDENVDGWGLAWYPDQSVALVKEPVSWRSSQHTDFLESYSGLVSSIYVGHVRHKTVGGAATHADTHPFVRELGGREYAFAHNGTLRRLTRRYRLSRFRPLGATDSELAFCQLLERIADRGKHLTSTSAFRWLHRELAGLNEHGKLNCVLSDGTSLFVYRDAAGYKGLVKSRLRTARHQLREFADAQMHLSFESGAVSSGTIFATHPLNDSDTTWDSLAPGELVVAQRGEIVFSSQQRSSRRRVVA